jgi:superfamily II DNA or RNA helicase
MPVVPLSLREYQTSALNDLLYYAQGIYQAPTGSGKTITMLAVIAHLKQRSLVIVNKKELVQQWVERAEQFLGYTPGFIGDGRWEEQDFTIAMQQTLWARRDELDWGDEFWQKWGLVVLDECHSVQAETYDEIMQRFTAMYRFGVSATPRKTGDFKICEAVLGPIIHTTAKRPLREQGYLVTPKVITVPTPFSYPYRRDQIAKNKKGREYVKKRNNWHDLVASLIVDAPRNNLIANTAQSLDKRTILILSKRLEHLEQLRQLLEGKRVVLLLTGAESLSERMMVYERASQGDCIILSTLADEAVDIPRIDTLFITFPTKNTELIRQQIGRGERPHPDKKDFLVYDFVDFSIPPIKSQYRDRKNFIYRPEEIEVTKLSL